MAISHVETKYGIALGRPAQHGDATVFCGIPYAQPPVNDLRFRAPRPPVPWSGEQTFDRWAPECIPMNPADHSRVGIGYPASEDCLRLNIWTSADSPQEKLPVVVWLHGSDKLYEANFQGLDRLASMKKLVIVTPIWRCGVLGFLGLEAFEDREPHGSSGNYGMLDVLAALQWVRENIEAFGGDPDLITLGGHSSGGTIVKAMLSSPQAAGLFQRAIIMSAGGVWDVDGAISKKDKYRLSEECMHYAGITTDDLLHMPGTELHVRMSEAMRQVDFRQTSRSRQFFRPSIDDFVMPMEPGKALHQGLGQDLDILCGSLISEWDDLLYQIPGGIEGYQNAFAAAASLSLAQRNAELGRKLVYHYFFAHCLPDGNQPFHGSELPYMFGRLDCVDCPWNDYDYLIENAMMDYWASFIRTGNPNNANYPQWSAYSADQTNSLLFSDNGMFIENLLEVTRTQEALQFLMEHPGMMFTPFF